MWLATNGIVVKGAHTVVLLALAAALTPSALGLVALGTLVATVAAILGGLGTASALVHLPGSAADAQRAARTALTLGLVTSTLLAAGLWVAAPSLASALRAEAGGAAVIRGLTVVLPCLAVAAVTTELLRRRLAFARRIVPDTVSAVVGAVVAVLLVAQGVGVMALVAGQVVQALLMMVLVWAVHPPVLPGWDRADARALVSFGLPFSGAHLLEVVQLNLDYLLVARVLGALALGHYSLSYRVANMPYLMVAVVVTGAAFPYLCRAQGPLRARGVEVALAVTVSLMLPACVLLALVADDLVLLGPEWAPAAPVLVLLAGYALLLAVLQVGLTVLNAAGRPGHALGVRLLHLLVLALVLLAVVEAGIAAVALGQVVAVAAVGVPALWLARRSVPGTSAARLLADVRPALVATAAMALAVVALRSLGLGAAAGVWAVALLAVAAVGVFLVVLRTVGPQTWRSARALLSRPEVLA
nr:oligosaccharide flippase family protein [Nocardioides marinisabuli]